MAAIAVQNFLCFLLRNHVPGNINSSKSVQPAATLCWCSGGGWFETWPKCGLVAVFSLSNKCRDGFSAIEPVLDTVLLHKKRTVV